MCCCSPSQVVQTSAGTAMLTGEVCTTASQPQDGSPIMSNSGTEKEPGCVRIWQESDEYKKMSGRNKIAQAARASIQEVKVWTDSANAINCFCHQRLGSRQVATC